MTTPPAIGKQNTTKFGAAGRPILRMGMQEEPPKRLGCRDGMSTGRNHTVYAPSSWAYDAHIPIENGNKRRPPIAGDATWLEAAVCRRVSGH